MKLTTDEWRRRGGSFRWRGHDIFVVDSGGADKPVVFLIHGFPTASFDWAWIWDELAKTHRLLALDLLGFGFSAKPNPHPYSILEQADLCEALSAELRLEAFHVLAHDYGDTVAQELLARQNEGRGVGRWLSLCLLNGGLFPETHRPRPIQKLLLTPLGPLVNRLASRRAFGRSFRAIFGPATQPSDAELDAFWTLIVHNDGRIMHRLIRYIPERRQYRERWVGALQRSVVPLGLVNGSVDPVSGAHMVARYREVVSADHFVVELPRIGHYPQVEAPEQVLEAYLRFLVEADRE